MTIKRRFERLSYYMKSEKRLEEKMEKMREQIDALDWTEEGRTQRIRLYQELGKIIEIYRMNRINIRWYSEKLLKNANLTG